MVMLNARTGELLQDDEVVLDSRVLQVIADQLCLMEGTEHAFSLMTFKRMFALYPTLMGLNGWAENFMAQANAIKPRFHVVSSETAVADSADNPGYESLELAKRVRVNLSELSRTNSSFVQINPPPGVVPITGAEGRRFTVKIDYEDKPSFEVIDAVDLSGISEGVTYGLDMDRLDRLLNLKLTLAKATYVYTQEYANQARDGIDHDRKKQASMTHADSEITLHEAIDAVLLSINLDTEEDYEEERARIDEALSDLDFQSLPMLLPPSPDQTPTET